MLASIGLRHSGTVKLLMVIAVHYLVRGFSSKEGFVSGAIFKALAIAVLTGSVVTGTGLAQSEKRIAKEKRAPAYPELAKRMNISGTV
jgi:hypothetical protein